MRPRPGTTIVAATALLLCGLATAQSNPPSSASDRSPSASLKLVSGTVTSISDEKVVVRTSDGDEMTFDLNSLTHRPASVRVGDRVQIDYEDGWTSDTATRITAMSGSAAQPPTSSGMHGSSPSGATASSSTSSSMRADSRFEPLQGTVVSLSDDRIVVRAASGEHKTFLLDPGQRSRLTVNTGDWVAVNFDERSGQQYATSVKLSPGERGYDASIGDYRNQPQYRAGNASGSQTTTTANYQPSGRLPQTASPLPLLALGGLLALGAAGAIRRLRMRG